MTIYPHPPFGDTLYPSDHLYQGKLTPCGKPGGTRGHSLKQPRSNIYILHDDCRGCLPGCTLNA